MWARECQDGQSTTQAPSDIVRLALLKYKDDRATENRRKRSFRSTRAGNFVGSDTGGGERGGERETLEALQRKVLEAQLRDLAAKSASQFLMAPPPAPQVFPAPNLVNLNVPVRERILAGSWPPIAYEALFETKIHTEHFFE
ncbi:hypothetical protein BDV95DRAFT_671062 [Massariosphaeria phaeospora]|uniref:Uncharacterized protein n=1 Tax=Massariosphaeria phaeospora TaxID=100035 RepID=A0A7C8M250_9PLEO|nr:hypothetical protein BDV95DRAFT_671062 [Massariosphaeria phaeospora]